MIKTFREVSKLWHRFLEGEGEGVGDGSSGSNVEQCSALRAKLLSTFSDSITNVDDAAIIVSPMRRTLQTAMLSLDQLVGSDVKVEANADWQGE